VNVVSAAITTYAVAATLHVQPGPDPTVVKDAAEAAAWAYAAERHALGADIAVSGLLAALHQPGLRTVKLTEPAADIEVAADAAAYCTGIALTLVEDDSP
jgi:phage-related baseplate assembly protein